MGIQIKKNLVYGHTEREVLTCDAYLPESGTDIPVVLLVHGGAFRYGNASVYTEWGTFLAENGICAVSVNYRMSTGKYAGYPGVLEDIAAAADYVVSMSSEWHTDPFRMAMMGDSAGACLIFLHTFRHAYASYRIRAVAAAYGLYDMVSWSAYNDVKWKKISDPAADFLGCSREENPELYEEVSPVRRIRDDLTKMPTVRPRIFLTWGKRDDFVPYEENSEKLAEILKEEGLSVETAVYEDCGHLWFSRDVFNHEICSLDKYPNRDLAPKLLEFLKETFAEEEFHRVCGELTCVSRLGAKL